MVIIHCDFIYRVKKLDEENIFMNVVRSYL
ncbi:hypothetical protein SAMN04488552_2544 [Christiangramia echinicola]|uniref:Uncharacterized protein n=1 Tax=Christiangramia echinicola TaxID=279359 RepID=A0A1H1QKK5_9FLAO|nr:hypothetical protein SAMN04488552_2544 [Christiangramia echinicola]